MSGEGQLDLRLPTSVVEKRTFEVLSMHTVDE